MAVRRFIDHFGISVLSEADISVAEISIEVPNAQSGLH
jgi:hypothetical protein